MRYKRHKTDALDHAKRCATARKLRAAGYSYAEIAERLGVKANSVGRLVYEAKQDELNRVPETQESADNGPPGLD
jgi:DNA-directed RNA polymerase specialized sigma24 family protein